jgi:hypothetical protein
MNKPYNIQNTNICNGIFHISFFKAQVLINEGERTRGEQDSGRNNPVPIINDCQLNQYIIKSLNLLVFCDFLLVALQRYYRLLSHYQFLHYLHQFDLECLHPD